MTRGPEFLRVLSLLVWWYGGFTLVFVLATREDRESILAGEPTAEADVVDDGDGIPAGGAAFQVELPATFR